jgi:5-methylcytosine-specific restriction endonuclease McrA
LYCKIHTPEKRKPFENAIRTNEALYKSPLWRQLKKQKLREQSYCSKCGISDNLHVHHVLPPKGNEDLFFDYNNLDVLCAKCHRLETNREIHNKK